MVVSALFFLSALPQVVRSQEEQAATTDAETEAIASSTEITATEPATGTLSVQNPNPYPTEGIPGGDSVAGDFVVGPGKFDLTIKAGETKVVQMTVTNRTGERRAFNLTVEDMTGSQDPTTGVVLLGSDRGPYSLRDYISFPATRFELGHNERARIPVTISIPADAPPGGLYGSALVDTVAIESQTGEGDGTVPQSAIVARVGTLFFLTVPGATERSGGLIDFASVPEKNFYQSGPINFGIYFENTGSIHLAPFGEVRIKNMFGDEVGAVTIEPWFVLPESKRLREVRWDRELLVGRYTATVQINRSYDSIVDTMSYSFWVLPWKLVGAAFGVVFIIIFLFRIFFRTFEFKRKR